MLGGKLNRNMRMYNAPVSYPYGTWNLSPINIPDLIAWYDFTDRSTQWQEIDSFTTQVSTSGNPIGRIKNKATGSHRLGNFLAASSDGDRPTWQNGYARFDGSNDHLFGKGQGNTGGVDGNNSGFFSDAEIDPHNISIFAIVHSDATTVLSDEIICAINGFSKNDNDEHIGIALKHESTTSDPCLVIDYESETNEEINWNTNMSTDVQYVGVTATSGTNQVALFLNDGADGQGTITNSGGRVLEFIHANNGFCIGEATTGSTGTVGLMNYDGDIGEILVYNRTLNKTERIEVERYLNDKYSIW